MFSLGASRYPHSSRLPGWCPLLARSTLGGFAGTLGGAARVIHGAVAAAVEHGGDGWLQAGLGSFQCLRLSARFSPAKLCLRGADTLCQAGTARGPRWDPLAGGVRLCSALCPPVPGSSPAGRGSFRAGVSWGSLERSPAPLPTQAPLPGGASRMGNISYGSGVNSRT